MCFDIDYNTLYEYILSVLNKFETIKTTYPRIAFAEDINNGIFNVIIQQLIFIAG